MSTPVFIGDEITAAGYRMAGLVTRTPDTDDILAELQRACEHAPLIIITDEYVAHLPSADRERCLSSIEPTVVVVPSIRSEASGKALVRRLRASMGVLE